MCHIHAVERCPNCGLASCALEREEAGGRARSFRGFCDPLPPPRLPLLLFKHETFRWGSDVPMCCICPFPAAGRRVVDGWAKRCQRQRATIISWPTLSPVLYCTLQPSHHGSRWRSCRVMTLSQSSFNEQAAHRAVTHSAPLIPHRDPSVRNAALADGILGTIHRWCASMRQCRR
ncbi:hypothetical protein NLU13_9692 [Sarocladium strictum]|uniref:Uncharacterized protein n=1 Tax=Sarocladium strictum TaxID=5046 RepID=A0AA39GAY1_SARSR|nr:hypothetical protein NLU13_9692 [Sarocladium strictum]